MNDPVQQWLKRHPHLTPTLNGEAVFHFDHATLHIRSNTVHLLKAAEDAFCNYTEAVSPIIPSSPLIIEVYYIERADEGFDPDTLLGRMYDSPTTEGHGDERYSSTRLQKIEINGVHCLWRPLDWFVALKNSHICRILTCDPVDAKNTGFSKSKLSVKGAAIRPENTPEIIDLIKILYVRHCNLCCIHGAAASWEGKGVIFTGPSGCGKTTTVLSLVRDGFNLLSDELTLIENHEPGCVWLRGLLIPPMVMGVRLDSLDKLENSLAAAQSGTKNSFAPAPSIVKASRNLAVKPSVVIYLEPASRPANMHAISEIQSSQGFSLLFSQILDLPGNDRCRFHFESLTSLLETSRHYRLVLGRDLESLPELIRGLLPE